jgi:hypothetical protein
MNNDLGIFAVSDTNHTEPWVEDTLALSTALFVSGKV